jgi:hypothetical protein
MYTLIVSLLALLLQSASSGRLTFAAPDGWKPRPASSSTRVAEFILPRAAGDAEDGELVLYFFGGQGGDVEANVNRWLGQMEQPDGKTSKERATRESRTVNGLAVTLLDVSGTYVAEVRPGSTEHFNKPGFRMRTAVVQTPRGPHFIKMVGPAKTIARWNEAFASFLASLKFQ